MGGFWGYLKSEKGISLNTIEYLIGKYGENISEEQIQRILKLLDTFKEINLDVSILNTNNQIFDIIDVEDEFQFEEDLMYVISYVKKRKKNKNKTPFVLVQLLLAAHDIRNNKKEEEAERIIELLEKEKLYFIFESKDPHIKGILYKSSYDTILKNISSLRKVNNYISVIKENPLIIINLTIKDLEKLFNEKFDNNEDEQVEEKEHDVNELKDIEDDEKLEDESSENDLNKERIEDNGNRYVKLGDEDKIKDVLEVFNKYEISYSILVSNPDILRRRKLYQVPEILDLMYNNNIPFSILYTYPEILEVCKTEDVEDIINALKEENISLTILVTQPEILLHSAADKIKRAIEVLEKLDVNKYIVYTYPDILISENIDVLAELYNVSASKINDINNILEVTEENYIFFEDLSTFDEEKEDRVINDLKESENVVIIKNTYNAKTNLEMLKDSEAVGAVKKDRSILNLPYVKVEQVLEKVNQYQLDKSILTEDVNIIKNVNAKNTAQVVEELKIEMPYRYNDVIKEVPSLLYQTDAKSIKTMYKVLESHNIPKTFVEENPKVLINQDYYGLDSILTKLEKNNFSTEDIIANPVVLVYGKEKYLKRNIETFKRNDLDIPLNIVYVISARNNEKNIDTLIENNMYDYIKTTPEILSIKNSTLMQRLKIAEENKIKIKDNEKLNLEYFMLSDKKVKENYKLKEEYVQKERENAETKEKSLRRVLDTDLYDGFFPILLKQASVTLKDYENDKVSYKKNDKVVSKQKVIRETYLDVEEKIASGIKGGIKKISAEKILNEKIDELTLGKKKIMDFER